MLMAAAKKLATPVMTLPLLPHARTREQATSLARRLRRVRLAELIRKLTVTENPCGVSHAGTGAMARTFTVSMKLRGPKAGDDDDDAETSADVGSDSDSDSDDITAEDDDGKVSFTQMAKSFKKEFTKRLYGLVKLELRRRGANPGRIEVSKPEKADRGSPGAAGDDDDDEAPGDGAAARRRRLSSPRRMRRRMARMDPTTRTRTRRRAPRRRTEPRRGATTAKDTPTPTRRRRRRRWVTSSA